MLDVVAGGTAGAAVAAVTGAFAEGMVAIHTDAGAEPATEGGAEAEAEAHASRETRDPTVGGESLLSSLSASTAPSTSALGMRALMASSSTARSMRIFLTCRASRARRSTRWSVSACTSVMRRRSSTHLMRYASSTEGVAGPGCPRMSALWPEDARRRRSRGDGEGWGLTENKTL